MISHTSARFRDALERLPQSVQRRAHEAYALFRADATHPGLHFKRVHATRPIYSVRVGLDYRALGIRDGDEMVWFWIGPHAEYDRLVARL